MTNLANKLALVALVVFLSLHCVASAELVMDDMYTDMLNQDDAVSDGISLSEFRFNLISAAVTGPAQVTTFNNISLGESNLLTDAVIMPALLGYLLNYPNPCKASEGTYIGYRLSKDMEIEIRVYNMYGYEIARNEYISGSPGGRSGYNKVFFDSALLPVGVYIYVLIYDNQVLGKSKMMVIK